MPDYRGSKIISNKGRSLKRARKGELLPAVTEYRVLTESPYGVSLVECKPVTGYKHQVRYESYDCTTYVQKIFGIAYILP